MLTEIKGLNEECGVFGIWGAEKEQAASISYYGLHSLQHRGQQSTGLVVKNDQELVQHRGLGLVSEVFSKDILENLRGTAAIGHVRYINDLRGQIADVQPFLFNFEDSGLAMCHNGKLVNAKQLRRSLEEKGSILQTSSDSEVLAHLIKRQKSDSQVLNIKNALAQLKGAFAYILLTQNEMIAALDPNGLRPLSIGRLGSAFVVASETCAFDTIGAKFFQDVNPGEMVIFNDQGMTVERYTENTSRAICSFEFIYLARPDSDISGVNIHIARKNMGKRLAAESPVPEADLVIAVPDSGISAAAGYAEAMQKPYELGLIKNRYIARTFIQPSQELREIGVKMKLSVVERVVCGKKVVVVDDSIVRGTTTKRIVQILREAGAAEIHVRVSSPVIRYPCFYGIDMQNTDELIGYGRSIEEVRQIIEADSLDFLSIEGLVESINLPYYDEKYSGLCVAYFNGDYPTELVDYSDFV